MSKSREELNELKKEVESVSRKLHELTPEELEQVTGGVMPVIPGVGIPFANAGGSRMIQEGEGRLGYGWQDKATP